MLYLYIAIGGFLGTLARYLTSRFLVARTPAGGSRAFLPLGTFIVNVGGSLLMGLFVGLSPSPTFYLLNVGFLGGLTTFSTLSYEGMALGQDGEYLAALAVPAAHLVVGLAAFAIGRSLA